MLLLVLAVILTQLTGRDPQVLFQAGMDAAKNGDQETVFRTARLLLKTPKFNGHAHMLRGMLFLEIGKYAAAVVEFQLASDSPTTRIQALTRSGEAFYRMRRFVDAEQVLLQVLEQDENNSDARRWLASAYYDLGSMALALEHLKIIGDTNPQDGRPFRLRGRIGKDFQHYGEAIVDYREALRRSLPDSEREAVILELADCQIQQLRYSEALETLQKAEASAKALSLQSACLAALGDTAQATRKADEALALSPELVPAILTRTAIDLEAGRPENVIGMLEKAAAREPGNFDILFQLVKALRQAGRNSEADSKSARLAELEQLAEEFSRLNAAAFRNNDDANLRFRLGQIAHQMDRPELARLWLEASLAITPDLVAARELLEELQRQHQ